MNKKSDIIREVSLVYRGVIYSKKNSKRIIRNRYTGRMSLISSDRARMNEADMIKQFRIQKSGTMQSPCEVSIKLYEPDWHRRDLDNQATAILDALVGAGILVDDGIKDVVKITVNLAGVDKKEPRSEISILSKGV